jgi:hypothetical protein
MAPPTCIRCGVFLNSATDVTYSDEGEPMCVACRERIDLDRKERREARTLVGLGLSSLGGALIALPTSLFFVLAAIPFSVSGMLCLRGLKAAPPGVISAFGGRRPMVRVAATLGVAVSVLTVAVMVVQIGLLLLDSRAHR